MQLVKIIRNTDPDELERLTNDFVENSGKVHYVTNLRVYPPGENRPEWCSYIIYKKKYEDKQ